MATRVELENGRDILDREQAGADGDGAMDPTRRGRLDEAFTPLLETVGLAALEADAATIYGMWPDSRLAYMNPAYVRFSVAEGASELSAEWGLGCRVLATVPEPLTQFYDRLIARALVSPEPITHRYDCHSPELARKYDLRLFSLGERRGLLLASSLVMARPHADPERADADRYRSANGLLTQCCHCRRVRRAMEPGHWDLVPDYIAAAPPRTTHGLCELCFAYHYTESS